MALVDRRVSRCNTCGDWAPMQHINGRQTQMDCDDCGPKVLKKRISDAIQFLVDNKVTPKQLVQFLKRKK